MTFRSRLAPKSLRLSEWLDVPSGIAGGLVLGVAVWFINVSHGYMGAATAATKQFAYTFLMGGLIMRLCTRIAQRPGSDAIALVLAVATPSAVTIGATFLVHSLRGTPEPALSTLPVAIVSPIGFGFWSRRVRRDGATPWEQLRRDAPGRNEPPREPGPD